MDEMKIVIYKRTDCGNSKITFYARGRVKESKFSELAANLSELAEKIVTKMTGEHKERNLDVKFDKPGIQRIQALENMKGDISTVEGLSEEEKKEFLNALMEEKSRINAE